MIIVVTGAAYSGRFTMERLLLERIVGAVSIPVVTNDESTASKRSDYICVSEQEFESRAKRGEFVSTFDYGELYRYGLTKKDLSNALTNSVAILSCDAVSAVELGRHFNRIGETSLCFYMYAAPKTLLARMSKHDHFRCAHEIVQDIYGDHGLRCSQIFTDSENGVGYTDVASINSSSQCIEEYADILQQVSALLNGTGVHVKHNMGTHHAV